MARGEPGVPRRFRWRGREYRVDAILPGWKEMSAPEGAGGDRYVRRHGSVVRTTDGSTLRLVAERGTSGRKVRWWVRRVDVPKEGNDPSEPR